MQGWWPPRLILLEWCTSGAGEWGTVQNERMYWEPLKGWIHLSLMYSKDTRMNGAVCVYLLAFWWAEWIRQAQRFISSLSWLSFSFDRIREETQKSSAVFSSPHVPWLPFNDDMYICASMAGGGGKDPEIWTSGKIIPICKNQQSNSASQHTLKYSAALKANSYPAMFPPYNLAVLKHRTQGPYIQDNL